MGLPDCFSNDRVFAHWPSFLLYVDGHFIYFAKQAIPGSQPSSPLSRGVVRKTSPGRGSHLDRHDAEGSRCQ